MSKSDGKDAKYPSDMEGHSRWAEKHHARRDACSRGRDPKSMPKPRKKPAKWAP